MWPWPSPRGNPVVYVSMSRKEWHRMLRGCTNKVQTSINDEIYGKKGNIEMPFCQTKFPTTRKKSTKVKHFLEH